APSERQKDVVPVILSINFKRRLEIDVVSMRYRGLTMVQRTTPFQNYLVLLTIAFMAFLSLTVGQETVTKPFQQTTESPPALVMPYFTIGGTGIDVHDFNEKTVPKGFRRIRDFAGVASVGIHRFNRSTFHGIELRLTQWESRATETKKIELQTYMALANFGFKLFTISPATELFPFFGAGIGITQLGCKQKEVDFSSLTQPNLLLDNELIQKTIVIHAGIELHHILSSISTINKAYIIGLRAGFGFDPSRPDDWLFNSIEVENGPPLPMTGPYAGLFFATLIKNNTPESKNSTQTNE
ncbi:MAG: hypothetical protein JW795_15770, partial [Chitinivibrionales bacterium]|nr:hypothetical protein [Chitinivibrionales bacterium]